MNGDAAAAARFAVVTGASRGIGLAVASALVASGFRVAMLARSEDDLLTHASELGDGTLALPLACDVTDAESVEHAARTVNAEFGGPPHVLVNCAGVFTLAPVARTDPSDFRDAMETNLIAPFMLVRTFLPAMIERRSGHIVTLGSTADRSAFPENAAYAASKFGLRAFHEVLLAELRGTGVRASLVSPGAVDTSLWDEIDPDTRPGFTPRRTMLQASAVADAVRYVVTVPGGVNVDELRLSHN